MANRPFTISITFLFILLSILIWLGFGMITAVGAHPAIPNRDVYRVLMATGGLGLTVILSGLFYLLAKQNRKAYFLMMAVLIATSVLTIFDDFGWTDLIVLLINLIPVGLLIKDRRWYLGGFNVSQ